MATQASDTANSTASKRMRGASPDDLAVVAQRAQAFTNASGVAIALSEGNADEIVCRARSGASAPEVGAALRVEGSFTGLCIQSGKELRCDDCETDTRVDTAAIRALGIRSMVVTPIREESRVVGVLAAFAPTPHAFTITHVAVLKTMADQISVLLQKERRARDENPQPEIPRPPAVIVAKPVIAPAPPAVVIKPSASAAAAPAFAKVEPIRSVPLEVVPLATPPKAEKRADVGSRTNFGSFDSMAADDPKPGNRFMMIGVVAVVIVAAAATFVFLKMQKPASSTPQHAQEATNVQPAQPSAPASNAQFETPAANAPAATAAPAVIVAGNPPSAASKSTVEIDARKPGSKTASEKAANTQQEKPEKQAVVATLTASGPSKISQRGQDQPTAEVAPSFSVGGGSAPPTLSSLARPVASSTPTEGTVQQSQLEPLQLIRSVSPVYPSIAKARNVTGMVVVQFKVGKDGRTSNPELISGSPIFKDAAFEAVSRCQFKPAKLNGHTIEQVTQMKFNFKQ
ncbi:MAG TPA: TonB family protein [Candidatus Angelobacter sp.]|nr:TonB family protein [Candidatus Angelobacter sp.]